MAYIKDENKAFLDHNNTECERFICLVKSIISIAQKNLKSSEIVSKEINTYIKSSPVFNKIRESMGQEEKSYDECIQLISSMSDNMLAQVHQLQMPKNLDEMKIVKNKNIYGEFLIYKNDVEEFAKIDKMLLNIMLPDKSYKPPLTMKQKFDMLNIKFDPSSEPTNSNAPPPLNEIRKASYNKNSGNYLCDPTNFEMIIPPTHKPSSSIIGKKNMVYYKIPIPESTEPGSRVRFKQPTPPIKNVHHNSGKNPPNCPLKQTLNIVNHIPTSKEINENRSKNINSSHTYKPTFSHTPVNTTKNYDKKSLTSRTVEKASDLAFISDQALGTDLFKYTPGALWFTGVKKLAGI